jgi:hypothetical protein
VYDTAMKMDKVDRQPTALRVLLSLRQQDWLALMLLGLHAALAFGIDLPVSQAFLLFHFGCFLLWQPVWRGDQKVYVGQALLIVGAAALLVTSSSWWLMALWLSVLFGLIGGEVPAIKHFGQRAVSLIAATYLLAILLVWVVPHLFAETEFGDRFASVVRYGPMAPLTFIFLIKTERAPRAAAYVVDLIYSLLLFLMVVVLVLGAFVIRQVSHGNYVVALAQALLVIGGILVAVSWLWDPRAGFAGIGHMLTRYFLSVGMPFERWMRALANLAETYGRQGRSGDAEAVRKRLAAVEPYPPFHFFNLGMAAMRQGDFRTARELFAREVARADSYHEFHFWLGVADWRLGDEAAARRHLALAMDNSVTRSQHDLYAAKLAWLQAHRQP